MWSSIVGSVRCFSLFLKATLSVNSSSHEGLLWKKGFSSCLTKELRFHASNNITQTSPILQHLISLQIAMSSFLPALFAFALLWRDGSDNRNLSPDLWALCFRATYSTRQYLTFSLILESQCCLYKNTEHRNTKSWWYSNFLLTQGVLPTVLR